MAFSFGFRATLFCILVTCTTWEEIGPTGLWQWAGGFNLRKSKVLAPPILSQNLSPRNKWLYKPAEIVSEFCLRDKIGTSNVILPFGSSTISTIPHENIIITGVVDYGNGVSRIKQMRRTTKLRVCPRCWLLVFSEGQKIISTNSVVAKLMSTTKKVLVSLSCVTWYFVVCRSLLVSLQCKWENWEKGNEGKCDYSVEEICIITFLCGQTTNNFWQR